MRPSLLHSLRHFAFYASGFLVGSALFCGAYMWSYHGTFPGIIVALALPVALFYFALLAVIRWRRPVLIGRAVFVVCGIAVGLFPMLGLSPIYMWRLPFALMLFAVHIMILAVIVFLNYFATRWMKATHAA